MNHILKRNAKRTGLILGAIVLLLTTLAVPVSAAQNVGTFSNFTVTYSGAEKFTAYRTKCHTNRAGAVNLSNDTGAAWITANMKNSKGEFRGGTTLKRGTRKTFSSSGTENYKYRLGLRKTDNTGGGSVTIKGSWAPDHQ